MQQVTDHSVFSLKAFSGVWPKLVDSRMATIETLVCAHYQVDRDDITSWKSTHDARMVNAFLMHHILDHSLRFLEKHYSMYYHALRYGFAEICKKALTDSGYSKELTTLIEACNNKIRSNTSGI